ncbi:MAG: hypothetical protein AB8G95_09830 [Anaerolineae bacterium]
MRIKLCDIPIALKTDIPKIQADWQAIFACHLQQQNNQQPAIEIQALPLDQAPPSDLNRPITQFESTNGTYQLALTTDGRSKLTLASGAIVTLPNLGLPYDKSQPIQSELYITPNLANFGQVEDITFALLAPIMRRFKVYIVHAFGVVHPTKPEAVLIIGRSGQGKTTTGLSLIEEGWKYLGNDAIFLSINAQGKIVAWPSPGQINLHPKSVTLLNQSQYLPKSLATGPNGKYHFSPQTFAQDKLGPTEVRLQLFPKIVNHAGKCQLEHLPNSIALSQTIEQSVDHWDTIAMEDHFTFLEQLNSQTKSFKAKNTTDLKSLSNALLNYSKQ